MARVEWELYAEDITIPDYFAAQALIGLLLAKPNAHPDFLAQKSYEMADAMMKARMRAR